MIAKTNKRNRSLVELAISDAKSLTDEEKHMLMKWLYGIVNFVDEAVKSESKRDIYGEEL